MGGAGCDDAICVSHVSDNETRLAGESSIISSCGHPSTMTLSRNKWQIGFFWYGQFLEVFTSVDLVRYSIREGRHKLGLLGVSDKVSISQETKLKG